MLTRKRHLFFLQKTIELPYDQDFIPDRTADGDLLFTILK